MLGNQGIVPPNEAADIVSTLNRFQDEMAAGELDFFDPKFAGQA